MFIVFVVFVGYDCGWQVHTNSSIGGAKRDKALIRSLLRTPRHLCVLRGHVRVIFGLHGLVDILAVG